MGNKLLSIPVLAAAVALSGCSASAVPVGQPLPAFDSTVPPSASSSSVPPVPTTPAVTPSIAPQPEIISPAPHTMDWKFANDSGYSYTMSIGLWDTVTVPADGTVVHPGKSSFLLGGTCSYDPQRDAVIPGALGAKVTTESFTTAVSMKAIISSSGLDLEKYAGAGVAPAREDKRIQVAQSFESGPSCKAFSSENSVGYGEAGGFGVKWTDPQQPGATLSHHFFIIVKNYRSPATPSGDQDLLNAIGIRPISSGDTSDAGSVFKEVGEPTQGKRNYRGLTLSGMSASGS
ncbi:MULTISPECIES: hypothetical protein [unclassified Arthrobacter]|uniref:hypothetical protein n=1 Tax=unclassified Arthrobacter TaxID=235627 RepID=UPI002882FBA9|nr:MULTISPECIES: hypothetical protein [unclassified Arthrobacter]